MSSLSSAIEGALAGMAAMGATYPLASLTTAWQTKSRAKGHYAGLESALWGIAVVNFVYYYVYAALKGALRRRGIKYLNVSQGLVVSLVAGIVSRIVSNPVWVANTRATLGRLGKKPEKKPKEEAEDEKSLQNDPAKSALSTISCSIAEHISACTPSTLSTIVNIYKCEGVAGLMSGLSPALVLVASPVVQFTLYEQISNVFPVGFSPKEALLWGGFTKLVAIMVTYPYYTLRTRLHVRPEAGMLEMTKEMYKEGGLGTFYAGLDAKLAQSVVNAGLLFYIKAQLASMRRRRANLV